MRRLKHNFKKGMAFVLSLAMVAGLVPAMSGGANTVQAATGSGTETDPYLVSTLSDLGWMSTQPLAASCWYVQTEDIDASDTRNWTGGLGMAPIPAAPPQAPRSRVPRGPSSPAHRRCPFPPPPPRAGLHRHPTPAAPAPAHASHAN